MAARSGLLSLQAARVLIDSSYHTAATTPRSQGDGLDFQGEQPPTFQSASQDAKLHCKKLSGVLCLKNIRIFKLNSLRKLQPFADLMSSSVPRLILMYRIYRSQMHSQANQKHQHEPNPVPGAVVSHSPMAERYVYPSRDRRYTRQRGQPVSMTRHHVSTKRLWTIHTDIHTGSAESFM